MKSYNFTFISARIYENYLKMYSNDIITLDEFKNSIPHSKDFDIDKFDTFEFIRYFKRNGIDYKKMIKVKEILKEK